MPKDRVVVVGDNIENDVGAAQAAGLKAVLVKTGKYRAELAAQSGIVPDAIIESVAELPTLLH